MYKYPSKGTTFSLSETRRIDIEQIWVNSKLIKLAQITPLDVDGTPHPDPNHYSCWNHINFGGEVAKHKVSLPPGLVLTVTHVQQTYGVSNGSGGVYGVRLKVLDAQNKKWKGLIFWITVKQLYALPEYPR